MTTEAPPKANPNFIDTRFQVRKVGETQPIDGCTFRKKQDAVESASFENQTRNVELWDSSAKRFIDFPGEHPRAKVKPPKEPKAPKTPREPKAPKDPNAPKKERKPKAEKPEPIQDGRVGFHVIGDICPVVDAHVEQIASDHNPETAPYLFQWLAATKKDVGVFLKASTRRNVRMSVDELGNFYGFLVALPENDKKNIPQNLNLNRNIWWGLKRLRAQVAKLAGITEAPVVKVEKVPKPKVEKAPKPPKPPKEPKAPKVKKSKEGQEVNLGDGTATLGNEGDPVAPPAES